MALIITPTGRRIFKVWWSFWWRAMLFSIITGIAIGILFAFFDFILSSNVGYSMVYIVGFIVVVYINFAVLKWVLTKKLYSDFTIALIEKEKTVEE